MRRQKHDQTGARLLSRPGGRARVVRFVSFVLGCCVLGSACQPRPAQDASVEPELSCEQKKLDLVSTLRALPEHAVGASVSVRLPESTLGGNLGAGPVLEVQDHSLLLDGSPMEGGSFDQRLDSLRAELAAWAESRAGGDRLTLYVAAAADIEVQRLRGVLDSLPKGAVPRLLFRGPSLPPSQAQERPGLDVARKILQERDPARRENLAKKGYQKFSDCDAVSEAVSRVDGLGPQERWPRLRSGLLAASESCSCESLSTRDLKHLIVAEQRAGSIAFGSIPLAFLRDQRCGASMPRRSIQKLLTQIEEFDAEFSGNWQEGGLAFDQVITNERLLNYFCDALPGETLAALQKQRATLYLRVGGEELCQAWTFSPLAPGSPMGTWKRNGGEPLSLHYRQGAEEVRIFGPAEDGSHPTDERKWSCDEDVRMEGIDEHSIQLTEGRWFFDETSCLEASAQARLGGCFGQLVSGQLISPLPQESPPVVQAVE